MGTEHQIDVLISEAQIRQKVREIGREIASHYAGKNPILAGVLKGSFMFLADLARAIAIPHEVDFLALSSYRGSTSSGEVRLVRDLSCNIRGRHVILVEGVVDTGRTLEFIRTHLLNHRPASLRIVALLRKELHRQRQVLLDYVGFVIADQFVVGYGLDLDERWRYLPYIGVVPEV